MQIMDASEGGVLKAIERMLCQIYIPALKVNTTGWGNLNKNQTNLLKNVFINKIESFANMLNGANESLEQKVVLTVSLFVSIRQKKSVLISSVL